MPAQHINLADLFEAVVDAVPDREALYCEGRRLKVTAMSFYAQNNMKGSGFRKEGEEASWSAVPEGGQDSPVFDRICAAPARP